MTAVPVRLTTYGDIEPLGAPVEIAPKGRLAFGIPGTSEVNRLLTDNSVLIDGEFWTSELYVEYSVGAVEAEITYRIPEHCGPLARIGCPLTRLPAELT